MTQIIERAAAHYEAREVPFGCIYKWYPADTALEYDCGEKLVLTSTSTITTCGCGADHGALIRGIQEREDRLRDEVTHPCLHDLQDRAEHNLRDGAYPKDSPWRYNDIPATNANHE